MQELDDEKREGGDQGRHGDGQDWLLDSGLFDALAGGHLELETAA